MQDLTPKRITETEYTFDVTYTLGETQSGSGQRGELLDGGTGDDLMGHAGHEIEWRTAA